MIIAVTGSRTWDSPKLLRAVLGSQRVEHLHVGDARGADAYAYQWALKHDIRRTQYFAAWDGEGKAAGMLRNRRMLEWGKPDILFAFQQGEISKGTQGCMKEAQARDIPIVLVKVP